MVVRFISNSKTNENEIFYANAWKSIHLSVKSWWIIVFIICYLEMKHFFFISLIICSIVGGFNGWQKKDGIYGTTAQSTIL